MPKTTISSAITPSKGRTERDGRLITSSRGAKGPLDEIRLLIKKNASSISGSDDYGMKYSVRSTMCLSAFKFSSGGATLAPLWGIIPSPPSEVLRKWDSKAQKKDTLSSVSFLGSGEWIRTTDLRVMREKPDFGNFDRITTQISQLYVLRFRLPKQSAVGNKSSYSKSFSGGSQVLFCYFSAFSFVIQSLKLYLPFCRGST